MSDHYAKAFAPRDPLEVSADAARTVLASVQGSLYGRLRGKFGMSNAGTIAWMLLHAAEVTHRNHAAAIEALESRTIPELTALIVAAEGAVKAAKTAEGRTIAQGVWALLRRTIDKRMGWDALPPEEGAKKAPAPIPERDPMVAVARGGE